jgi:TATA-binding protein-associated factor
LTLEKKPARGLALKEGKDVAVDSEEVIATKLVYRGAQLALSELAARFDVQLLDKVPKLWSCMSESLLSTYASGESPSSSSRALADHRGAGDIATADAIISSDDGLGQDLLDCLTVLPTGAQKLGSSLHGRLRELLPSLALATQSQYAVVRYAVARCFAALCDIVPVDGLRHVVESVIPTMGDPVNVNNRRGAIELVSRTSLLLSSSSQLLIHSPCRYRRAVGHQDPSLCHLPRRPSAWSHE